MHEQYTPERPHTPDQAQELLDLAAAKIKEAGEHYENADAIEGQLDEGAIPELLKQGFSVPDSGVISTKYEYELIWWNRMDAPRTHGEVASITFAQTTHLSNGESDLIHVSYELLKDDADSVKVERRISGGHDDGSMYPGGIEAVAEAVQRVPRLFYEDLSEDEADEEVDEYIDYFEEIADRSVEARRLHEESRQQERDLGLTQVSFKELSQIIDLVKRVPLMASESSPNNRPIYEGIDKDIEAILQGLEAAGKTGEFEVPNDKASEGKLVILEDDPGMIVYQIVEVDVESASSLCEGLNTLPFVISIAHLRDAGAMNRKRVELTKELRLSQTLEALGDIPRDTASN